MNNSVIKAVVIALIWGAIIISCKSDKVEKVSGNEVVNLPDQEILDFKYHHSEQGVMRTEVLAKQLILRMVADTPYYAFPKGLYARSFTADSIPESDIKSDSAIFREQPRFFSASGNIVVRNFIKNMRLETQGPLYWDEAKKEIYTDAYAIIIRPPDTIPALNGLVADDRFTTYSLRTVKQGVIYKEFASKDSLSE